MKKREFLKKSGLGVLGMVLAPELLAAVKNRQEPRLRTAHIGVGNMGAEDLKAIASHAQVEVVALCDVDAAYLKAAAEQYPAARTFSDYRVMLTEMAGAIDAVVVSTPDHTHAPASMLAMELNKSVYCQ